MQEQKQKCVIEAEQNRAKIDKKICVIEAEQNKVNIDKNISAEEDA